VEIQSTPAITVLFALPDEARAFCKTEVSKSVRVHISGVGAKKTQKAVETLFPHPSEQALLLIVGFAGGLSGSLPVGSLIVAESVVNPLALHKELKSDSLLLAQAEAVQLTGVTKVQGKLVTVPNVLTTVAEKKVCAQNTGAIAVDMETFAGVQAAQARGVRCLAVRVITDGVDDTLPLDFNALSNAQGEPDRGKIVAHILLRPWKIPALIRLGTRSAKAANHLAQFLEVLITRLTNQ